MTEQVPVGGRKVEGMAHPLSSRLKIIDRCACGGRLRLDDSLQEWAPEHPLEATCRQCDRLYKLQLVEQVPHECVLCGDETPRGQFVYLRSEEEYVCDDCNPADLFRKGDSDD